MRLLIQDLYVKAAEVYGYGDIDNTVIDTLELARTL